MCCIATTVLATCGIHRPELAYEDTQLCLLFLADFPEKCKISGIHLLNFTKGMDTVQGILIFIMQLVRLCLRSLHQRYLAWTKPDTSSLLLGMLTDLARGKSELVAENALLRQQLII